MGAAQEKISSLLGRPSEKVVPTEVVPTEGSSHASKRTTSWVSRLNPLGGGQKPHRGRDLFKSHSRDSVDDSDSWLPDHLRPPSIETLTNILSLHPPGALNTTHFETAQILGIGTFGTVKMVRVKRDQSQTPFALKMISKWKMAQEWGPVPVAATALIREIEVLKRLKSPFIVNFFRCFHDEENAYILLEFVNGGEVSHLISQEDRLATEAGRFITCELVMTMGELHKVGVIFRDLKPANVLFDAGGHIKVVDFGLAKILDDNETNTICDMDIQ